MQIQIELHAFLMILFQVPKIVFFFYSSIIPWQSPVAKKKLCVFFSSNESLQINLDFYVMCPLNPHRKRCEPNQLHSHDNNSHDYTILSTQSNSFFTMNAKKNNTHTHGVGARETNLFFVSFFSSFRLRDLSFSLWVCVCFFFHTLVDQMPQFLTHRKASTNHHHYKLTWTTIEIPWNSNNSQSNLSMQNIWCGYIFFFFLTLALAWSRSRMFFVCVSLMCAVHLFNWVPNVVLNLK